jgi:hypothetical protein
VGAREAWFGSPARFLCATPPVDLVALSKATPSLLRMFFLTLGQYLFPFVVATVLSVVQTSPIVIFYFTYNSTYATFGNWIYLIFPLPFATWFVLTTCLLILVLKWVLIGTYTDQVVWVYSWRYLLKWTFDGMWNSTLFTPMRAIYASLYLPPWLRCLGAKLGPNVEISTMNFPNHDQLHLDQGAFIADSAFVGVSRFHLGFCHTGPVFVGAKSFVGNSALVPSHSRVGNNSLIGVLSTGPRHWGSSDDDLVGSVADLLSRGSKGAVAAPRPDHRLYRDAPTQQTEAAFVTADVPQLPRTGVAPAFFIAGAANPANRREVKIMIDSDDDDDLYADRGRLINSPFAKTSREDDDDTTSVITSGDGVALTLMPAAAGGCCWCCPIPAPWPAVEDRITSQTAQCVVENDSDFIGSPGIRMPRRFKNPNLLNATATYDPPASLVRIRLFIEFVRLVTPYLYSIFVIMIYVIDLEYLLESTYVNKDPVKLFLVFGLLWIAIEFSILLSVLVLKWIMLWRIVPGETPLWSSFVWRGELIVALLECITDPTFGETARGTPWAAVRPRYRPILICPSSFAPLSITIIFIIIIIYIFNIWLLCPIERVPIVNICLIC